MILYFFKNMAKLTYFTHHKAEKSILILLNLFLFKALVIYIFDNGVVLCIILDCSDTK